MKKIQLLAVLTIFIGPSVFAAPFDFKGVEIDGPATPSFVKSKLGVECGAGLAGIQVCNGRVTLAGKSADMNLVISQSGRVQRIALRFDTDDYAAIEAAAIQKFGEPLHVETGTVGNRMGATFPQRTDVWGNPPAPTVRLSRYAGTLDHGSLVFRSEEDRKMLERSNAGDPNDF